MFLILSGTAKGYRQHCDQAQAAAKDHFLLSSDRIHLKPKTDVQTAVHPFHMAPASLFADPFVAAAFDSGDASMVGTAPEALALDPVGFDRAFLPKAMAAGFISITTHRTLFSVFWYHNRTLPPFVVIDVLIPRQRPFLFVFPHLADINDRLHPISCSQGYPLHAPPGMASHPVLCLFLSCHPACCSCFAAWRRMG